MDRLDVRMLGDFSITYNNKKIPLGRGTTPKYMLLMQYIMLEDGGGRGVTKAQMVKALYDESEVANSNNSINNMLYQLRMKLEKLGLPRGEYIVRSDELYTMAPELDIHLDVHEFENCIRQASGDIPDEKKEELYRQAFELYQGELLPRANTEIWVIVESVRLEACYRKSILWLADYYKKKADYRRLEYLFRRAAQIDPYNNWEIGWIDALADAGNYKQAYQVYSEMAKRYLEEFGGSVTDEMLKCYDRIGERIRQIPGGVEQIKKEIGANGAGDFVSEQSGGAYYCNYRNFLDICHIFRRNMERTGGSFFLMVCTALDCGDKNIQDADRQKEIGSVLREAISSTLRRSDVYTQYSVTQYMILLTGTNQENCENICSRIRQAIRDSRCGNVEIKYMAISLADI